jgi:hypothetical protein
MRDGCLYLRFMCITLLEFFSTLPRKVWGAGSVITK